MTPRVAELHSETLEKILLNQRTNRDFLTDWLKIVSKPPIADIGTA
jgi:hypothetical protein